MKIADDIKKSSLGTIGEMLVAANIMSLGHDAVLANMTVSNVAHYDLICRNGDTGQVALVQVKTCVEKKFPVGLQVKDASTDLVDKKVVGPWVFVYVNKKKLETDFQYYILTKKEVIALIKQSNDWYQNQWYRSTPVKDTNAVSLRLEWINGSGVDKVENKYEAFENPLKGVPSKDRWDKLWIE